MSQLYDVIILGAGACGLFTATQYSRRSPSQAHSYSRKRKEALGKVRISGGGRCNLTNGEPNLREFVKNYPRGNRELLGAFSRFSNKDTVKWFETHQVALKEEGDGRVFPLSNSFLDKLKGQ